MKNRHVHKECGIVLFLRYVSVNSKSMQSTSRESNRLTFIEYSRAGRMWETEHGDRIRDLIENIRVCMMAGIFWEYLRWNNHKVFGINRLFFHLETPSHGFHWHIRSNFLRITRECNGLNGVSEFQILCQDDQIVVMEIHDLFGFN